MKRAVMPCSRISAPSRTQAEYLGAVEGMSRARDPSWAPHAAQVGEAGSAAAAGKGSVAAAAPAQGLHETGARTGTYLVWEVTRLVL